MQTALNKRSLWGTFAVCLFLQLTVPVVAPWLRLGFFVPFLVIAVYTLSLDKCLWLAFLCGLLLDMLSGSGRFGLFPLAYCLAMLVLYPQRRHFFSDSLSTLPLMTGFFSSLLALLTAGLLFIFDMHPALSLRWLATECVAMPAADAMYAWCLFVLPQSLFGKKARKGRDYFLKP